MECVLERFEEELTLSLIDDGALLDMSNGSVEGSMNEFVVRMERYFTDRDCSRIHSCGQKA